MAKQICCHGERGRMAESDHRITAGDGNSAPGSPAEAPSAIRQAINHIGVLQLGLPASLSMTGTQLISSIWPWQHIHQATSSSYPSWSGIPGR
jgi:hypothetical protein